jgi:thymidylate synthase (FAD)
MAPEVARAHLPLSTYTRKRWQCDLHNLLHFLSLRMDPHAQKEIRDYADAIAVFTKQLFPITFKAFEDYRINALTFSAMELEIIKRFIDKSVINDLDQYSNILGKTEMTELKTKLEKLIK